MNHAELIKFAIPLWYAEMAWAKELIKYAFNLENAEHILRKKFRGRKQVPGASWYIRTHGVDVYKTPEVGGIDFDFDKPDPDGV